MDLIHNERIKLAATFLNGIAVAIFAVGGLSPLFTNLATAGSPGFKAAVTSGICTLAAFTIHYAGSLMLKRMKP